MIDGAKRRIGVFGGARQSFPSNWMFPQTLRADVFAVYRPHRPGVHRFAPDVSNLVPHILTSTPTINYA